MREVVLLKAIDRIEAKQGFFDSFLLATQDGKLLYQTNWYLGSIERIEDLIPSESASGSGKAMTAEEKVAAVALLLAPGMHEGVRVHAEDYVVFAEPVSIDALFTRDGKAGAQAPLVLLGTVPKARLVGEERELPAPWLIAISFLIILTILAWPTLKLWLMAPHERLTGVDVRVLGLCLLAGAGMITFLVLDVPFYFHLGEAFDSQLEELAEEVESTFTKELVDAYRQLRVVLRASQAGEFNRLPATYRDFDPLVLTDAKGRPLRAWSPPQDGSTQDASIQEVIHPPAVDVNDRRYFMDAQSKKLWALKVAKEKFGEDSEYRFAGQIVKSRTSGEYRLVLASPVDNSDKNGNPRVALIASKMVPFVDPIVAESFGFAFIDSDGATQIHSVGNREEDFFKECDNNAELRAAVSTRRAQTLDVSYYGREYRLHVRPIAGTPWSLVVFRDERLLQAVNSEITTSWAALFLSYLAVYALVLIFQQVLADGYQAPWCWPQREKGSSARYLAAAMLLAISSFLGFHMAAQQEGLGRAVVLLAFPPFAIALLCLSTEWKVLAVWERRAAGALLALSFLALALTFGWTTKWASLLELCFVAATWAIFRIRDRLQKAAEPGGGAPRVDEVRFRISYVGLLFSVVALVAVVPSAVFFFDAQGQEVTNLWKLGQVQWLKSKKTVAGQLRDDYAKAWPSDGKELEKLVHDDLQEKDQYKMSWLSEPVVHLLNSDHSQSARCTPEGKDPAIGWFRGSLTAWLQGRANHRRFASELRDELREMAGNCANDNGWRWDDEPSAGKTVFRVQDPALLNMMASSSDRVPNFPPLEPIRNQRFWSAVVALSLCASFLGFGLLWSVARLVFLLDADRDLGDVQASPPSPDVLAAIWEKCKADEKLALRQLAEEGFLNPNNIRTARELMEKGLIRRRPAFWMSKEFRRLVVAEEPSDEMAKLAARGQSGLLRLSRLLLLLVIVAAFFFYTWQRQTFDWAVAAITGFGAALPSILNVLAFFGDKGAGSHTSAGGT